MRIAIIGAGFTGIATAWFLLKEPGHHIDLFDPAGVGGGASGMAAGLLHTFAGLHAKMNPMGIEGYRATKELLDVAGPVYSKTGLLRIALSEANQRDYSTCAEKNGPDVQWWSLEECQKSIPAVSHPGIFISSALMVNSMQYLQGLWEKCTALGALLHKETIHSLHELKDYDAIAICAGTSSKQLIATSLQLTAVKGQILELEWPADVPPLPFPLNTQAYIMMQPDHKSCIVGSTYEHQFTSTDPDLESAVRDIMPKVAALLPPLKHAKILNCRAGLRASTPDHLPLLKQIDTRCWLLSGMGSKGLLYHALYAKQLATQLRRLR